MDTCDASGEQTAACQCILDAIEAKYTPVEMNDLYLNDPDQITAVVQDLAKTCIATTGA